MTDLAERFARALQLKPCPFGQSDCAGHRDGAYSWPPRPECLPIIWAECKANGWEWNMGADGDRFTGDIYPVVAETVFADDPITAIVTAFCEAVEATETPATPRNRVEQ